MRVLLLGLLEIYLPVRAAFQRAVSSFACPLVSVCLLSEADRNHRGHFLDTSDPYVCIGYSRIGQNRGEVFHGNTSEASLVVVETRS